MYAHSIQNKLLVTIVDFHKRPMIILCTHCTGVQAMRDALKAVLKKFFKVRASSGTSKAYLYSKASFYTIIVSLKNVAPSPFYPFWSLFHSSSVRNVPERKIVASNISTTFFYAHNFLHYSVFNEEKKSSIQKSNIVK